MKTWLTENFSVKYPIILAPMFLVSNKEMLVEAFNAGIMGCAPAHNWKKVEAYKEQMSELKSTINGTFGVNLIVNSSNRFFKEQLYATLEILPDFVITSLGNPGPVIQAFKNKKTKVFCDVTDLRYAQKVEELGADALVAVNSGAGGHAGKIPASVLIPLLKKQSRLPVINAGGVGSGEGLLSVLALGAEGASIGTPFIASKESPVNSDYKNACVKYGAKDIVLSTKLSGEPCTLIETPYVKKIGTGQGPLEAFLMKNKKLKKYFRMITWYFGMKKLEAASYNTVWCAGPSVEFTKKILSVEEIVARIIREYHLAKKTLQTRI